VNWNNETYKLLSVSVGLSFLEKNNYVSDQSEIWQYKINNNVVNHDGFVDRSEIIIKTQGAKTVEARHSL
jgi:hypothetical protein